MNTVTSQQPLLFDDTLGLGQEEFRAARLIVFAGISGSGKSTALKFLCDHHPGFSAGSRRWLWMMGSIPDVKPIRGHRLVVVDELCHPRQLPVVGRLLGQHQTVVVASHLRSAWFWPFRLAGKCCYYSTGGDRGKIGLTWPGWASRTPTGPLLNSAAATARVTLIWTVSSKGIPGEASTMPCTCRGSWIS